MIIKTFTIEEQVGEVYVTSRSDKQIIEISGASNDVIWIYRSTLDDVIAVLERLRDDIKEIESENAQEFLS